MNDINLIVIEFWDLLSWATLIAAALSLTLGIQGRRRDKREIRRWMDRCDRAEGSLATLGYYRGDDELYYKHVDRT